MDADGSFSRSFLASSLPSTTGAIFTAGTASAENASPTPASLPVGPDGTVLLADSTQPLGLRWAVPPAAPVSRFAFSPEHWNQPLPTTEAEAINRLAAAFVAMSKTKI